MEIEIVFRFDWRYFINSYFMTKYGLYYFAQKRVKELNKSYPNAIKTICNDTDFLPENISLKERVYCLYHKIYSRLKCIECCKEDVKFVHFQKGYKKFCSVKCCQNYIGHLVSKKLLKIEENGNTRGKNNYIKKTKTIKSNGLSIIQNSVLKTKQTMLLVDENGLNGYDRLGLKVKEIVHKIGPDGLSPNDKRVISFQKTIHTIDENGITPYQRMAFKRHFATKTHYYNSSLIFQGDFEKHFLDQVKEIGYLHLLSSGPRIHYDYHLSKHGLNYIADFSFLNIIFEVKSDWTYDHCGKNEEERIKCNSKFKSAVEKGYRLIIIWNKKFYSEVKTIVDIKINILEKILFTLDI